MEPNLYQPFERSGQWWFSTPLVEVGPFGTRTEASMNAGMLTTGAEMMINETRELCSGAFDELIGLPVSFVGPLIGLSTEQARRRMPVIQASARDSRVSLRAAREFIASKTRQPKPLSR